MTGPVADLDTSGISVAYGANSMIASPNDMSIDETTLPTFGGGGVPQIQEEP
jgi:hypothetical protein